jgi:hypothetical protein
MSKTAGGTVTLKLIDPLPPVLVPGEGCHFHQILLCLHCCCGLHRCYPGHGPSLLISPGQRMSQYFKPPGKGLCVGPRVLIGYSDHPSISGAIPYLSPWGRPKWRALHNLIWILNEIHKYILLTKQYVSGH